MKRFDYWCEPCKNKFEELVTSDMIVRCPECDTKEVRRLMSSPTILNTISDTKLRDTLSEDFY
ncbi:MAG: hypothetical protein HN802_02580 [Candidatus Jacksonbacteria bacterium]|jgi:putative FmdB family regulatory protein|nr:hypothetical protein [Candidatus Jacksonbacteria bacterium]